MSSYMKPELFEILSDGAVAETPTDYSNLKHNEAYILKFTKVSPLNVQSIAYSDMNAEFKTSVQRN